MTVSSPPAKPPATGHQSDVEKYSSNSVTPPPESNSGLPTSPSFSAPHFRPFAPRGRLPLVSLSPFPWRHPVVLPSQTAHQPLGYVRLFHISVLLNIRFPLPEYCSTRSPVPNSHHLLRLYLNSTPWMKTSLNSLRQSLLPLHSAPIASWTQPFTTLIILIVIIFIRLSSSWDH